MKAAMALGLAVALSGTTLIAQTPADAASVQRSTMAPLISYQQCDLQKLEKYYLISLDYDVEGVVVGALREIAKIKLAQPACTSEPIENKVNDLITTGATSAIRYKAYLTSIVLTTPWAFQEEGVAEFMTDEQFFTALAHKLENIALRDER